MLMQALAGQHLGVMGVSHSHEVNHFLTQGWLWCRLQERVKKEEEVLEQQGFQEEEEEEVITRSSTWYPDEWLDAQGSIASAWLVTVEPLAWC